MVPSCVTALVFMLGAGSGKVLQVDLGWHAGYCHVIVAGDTLLVQVEDHGRAPLGWPTRWFQYDGCWWRDRGEMRLTVPCCMPGPLVEVQEREVLGACIGHGHHWGSGAGFWWLAIPGGKWEVRRLE